ncbi:MAG: DUF177 domain-containing protein [Alteripontixanthobacter sp.]
MSESELPRLIRTRPLPGSFAIEANAEERTALARRFAIEEVTALSASGELEARGGAIVASGILQAEIVRDCAISGEAFASELEEPIALRFVQELTLPGAIEDPEEGAIIEIDLEAHKGDEIEYSGDSFDLGEAIAQTLGLAIDPYAEGPDADKVRKDVGLEEPARDGPFAALAGLKRGS